MNGSKWMQVLPAKRWEWNCTERYLRGLKNQYGEHLVNICEQTSSKVIAKWISQNFTTLFPVGSTNDKNKNNSPQVIGDGCNHLWILAIILSVFYQVLNAVSDGVFKRKCLMEK